MEHVIRTAHPRLRAPVLLAAFEGWNDAGEAATFAVRFLADQWGATSFASIDPEEFFDFTTTRPEVRLDEGMMREIVWPSNELLWASVPGADVDVVLLVGTEPQLRWRTFAGEIVDLARELDARLVVTLGALLAEVPHTRPVSIVGNAYDAELVARLGLQHSRYQGPTGIVGVLHDAMRSASIPSASLWGAVPTYVPGAPSPKAALALIERTAELLAVPVQTTELEIASASYERQIDSLVADDDDTAAYVARLEADADTIEADDDDDDELDPDDGDLIEEVERFLRENPG
jgi:predicted ATP-grasp superfamily ATP-dependent carboligase